MKVKSLLSVLISWQLVVVIPAVAESPTEEELKALEQQIEQQEAAQKEAKKRAEEEARRAAEEQKLREERTRLEEERRKLEQEREAARIQAEAGKQRLYEQYMKTAKESMASQDFGAAEKNYRQALEIIADDTQALAGIEHIRVLIDRCQSIIGDWGWEGTTQTMTFETGGVVIHRASFNTVVKNTWKCADPENYRFEMTNGGSPIDYFLSEDGNKLKGYDPWGNISFAHRNIKQ